LIVHREIKLDNYAGVIELMKHPENGVPMKDRSQFFISYR